MFIVHTISPYRHRIFLCFFGGILEVFWGNTRALGPAVPGEEGWPVAADPEGSALHVPWHTSSDGEIGKQAMNASGCFRITSSTVHQPWGSSDHKKRLFACLLCHCHSESQMSAPRQVQMDSIQETKVVVHSACCCCYDGCVPELNNIGCAAQEKGGEKRVRSALEKTIKNN